VCVYVCVCFRVFGVLVSLHVHQYILICTLSEAGLLRVNVTTTLLQLYSTLSAINIYTLSRKQCRWSYLISIRGMPLYVYRCIRVDICVHTHVCICRFDNTYINI
jgi:hypothetical protein